MKSTNAGKRMIYEVYDVETGVVDFTGTSQEIGYKYDVPYNAIYHYRNKCKMRKKYMIRPIGVYNPPKDEVKTKKLTKEERVIGYLIRHLKMYGNVYINENPDKYLNILKKQGYKVKVDKYITVDGGNIVINEKVFNGRKNKHHIDYVLTRLV